jgi:hypothetical protein
MKCVVRKLFRQGTNPAILLTIPKEWGFKNGDYVELRLHNDSIVIKKLSVGVDEK